jgi:pimeloyl-ACP methyl ester carboxylesterase
LKTHEPQTGDKEAVARSAIYLELDAGTVRALTHTPGASGPPSAGVVFCSPFGWQEFSTSRAFTVWGDALAAAGFPAIRIDLPGTGESAGTPRDPARLRAWTEAIGAAARYLRTSLDCERTVALGVGVGGLLAYHALAEDEPIDDLVLFAVPARGTAHLREMTAFANLLDISPVARRMFEEATDSGGPRELAGFILPDDVLKLLERVDLARVAIPRPNGRRALLLGRDSLPADHRLLEHLERSGVEVATAPGTGFSTMMQDPIRAASPREAIRVTIDWLDAAPARPSELECRPVVTSDHCELDGVRERQLGFEWDGQTMYGTLTEPDGEGATAPLCAVLFTPGAGRRIGPQRMWVEVARRWAVRGIPTLRVELLGASESDGADPHFPTIPDFYRDDVVAQAIAVLDGLEQEGLPGSFLLGGLCSGGYWGLHAALRDKRVRATILLMHPLGLFIGEAGAPVKHYARRTLSLLAHGRLVALGRAALTDHRIRRSWRTIRSRVHLERRSKHPLANHTGRAFAKLHARGTQTFLFLDERGDEVRDAMQAIGGGDGPEPWPGVHAEWLSYCHHTIGPVVVQRRVHDAFDRALDSALKLGTQPAQRA